MATIFLWIDYVSDGSVPNDSVLGSEFSSTMEGLPEAEGNKPIPNRFNVQYHLMELVNIEECTNLVFFGTEDSYLDYTANSLNNKFNFLLDYKKAQKSVGKVWCSTKSKNYYIYSLIVAKTYKDKVKFSDVESCCRELTKLVRKDAWNYVGIEAFVDWSDDNTFTEKVVTLLRNMLPKNIYALWVCYRKQEHDAHGMVRKPNSLPLPQV